MLGLCDRLKFVLGDSLGGYWVEDEPALNEAIRADRLCGSGGLFQVARGLYSFDGGHAAEPAPAACGGVPAAAGTLGGRGSAAAASSILGLAGSDCKSHGRE